MKETNLIIFETDPFDPLDEDEVKLVKIFEKELHEKIKQFVENKQMVINLISTPNKIKSLLGDDLASKFLKGRLKKK